MPVEIPGTATLSDANKALLLQKVAESLALLPFLISMTDGDRKKLSKLGDKTMGWHLKCKDYMTQAPTLVPGFVDMTVYTNFSALLGQLGEVDHDFAPYARAFEDTLLMLGHQVYSMDLAFYQSAEQAAKRGVPGAQAIYNDLKTRFPGRPPAAATPATSTSH